MCVLTAGFPCQDISVAGPRTGLGPGTRSGLWRHAARAIEALNPCLVVIENVRGILSTRTPAKAVRNMEPCPRHLGDRTGLFGMRTLGVVLGELANLGYDASWTCLRASDIGAPHRRERVFVVAWPASPAEHALAEDADGQPGNGGSQHPEKRKAGRHGPTLADEIEHLLPTPTASDGAKGSPNQKYGNGSLTLASTAAALSGRDTPTSPAKKRHRELRNTPDHDSATADRPACLLPTQTSSDGNGGTGTTPKRKGGMNLRTAVTRLPTGGATTCPSSADGST